jgi:type I restriction enzyme S subunit
LGTDQLPSEYIYSWINQIIDKLVASQTGGAQQHINKGNVQEANILLPNGAVLDEFIDQVRPAFDQIALSCFESESLTKLRDTLLPKLVSGDIRISEAEQLTA